MVEATTARMIRRRTWRVPVGRNMMCVLVVCDLVVIRELKDYDVISNESVLVLQRLQRLLGATLNSQM